MRATSPAHIILIDLIIVIIVSEAPCYSVFSLTGSNIPLSALLPVILAKLISLIYNILSSFFFIFSIFLFPDEKSHAYGIALFSVYVSVSHLSSFELTDRLSRDLA
jgi:hypothetical protein